MGSISVDSDKCLVNVDLINAGFGNFPNHSFTIVLVNTPKNNDVCLLNVDAEVQEGWLESMYESLIIFYARRKKFFVY